MAILQAKEYQTSSGYWQLQFPELVGAELNEFAFEVLSSCKERYKQEMKEKYGAVCVELKNFYFFRWEDEDKDLMRLYKNELNKKARKIKLTSKLLLEKWIESD